MTQAPLALVSALRETSVVFAVLFGTLLLKDVHAVESDHRRYFAFAGLPRPDERWPAGHYLSITGGHCDITGFAPGIRELGPKQGM